MILPFHKELEQQEFRKFIDDQDLLRSINFYSEIDMIPPFVFEADVENFGALTSYVVYVDDLGNEISRVQLTNDEIQQKLYLGKYLYFSIGGRLTFEFEYCRYYIEIQNSSAETFYSEIITKIRQQYPDGRLKLNTGAYYNLNTGGFILLNTYQDGYILDKLTRIKASTTKNYGNSDFSGIDLIHYVDTRPFLEENYESTISEENAGEETVFQKVIISVYSLTFFAVEAVADNLQNLPFFDTIEITTPENKIYTVVNRVEVLREERINSSGVYQIKITFQTEYKIDLQTQGLSFEDDDRVDFLVGRIFYSPAYDINIAEFLAVKNTLLEGTGYEAVQCTGQSYVAADYPKLAAIMGTFDDAGTDKVLIPNIVGLIPVGAGGYRDKNGDQFNFTSSQYDWGAFKHKLERDEMYNFHVISGGGSLQFTDGSIFVTDSFGNIVNGDLNTPRDLSNLNEFDSDTLSFNDLIERYIENFNGEIIGADEIQFLKSLNKNRYVSTLNDNDSDVLDDRELHNNIMPCVACFAWTIIDKI